MNDQKTVTLTEDQFNALKNLNNNAEQWANKLYFLAEVTKDSGGSLEKLPEGALIGMGHILNNISVGLCDVGKILEPVLEGKILEGGDSVNDQQLPEEKGVDRNVLPVGIATYRCRCSLHFVKSVFHELSCYLPEDEEISFTAKDLVGLYDILAESIDGIDESIAANERRPKK